MTPTSALAVAAWSLVAGRLALLASRGLRARRVRVVAEDGADDEWRPRVTSGCGR